MTKPAPELRTKLINKFKRLNYTRKKIDSLYDKNLIVNRDIDFVYDSLFLSAVSYFENFIEELFIELSCDNYSGSSTTKQTQIFPNKPLARKIIFSGKKYVDWFPYDRTTNRAKIFFRNGHTFTNLSVSQKNLINNEILVIRNFIAHRSVHAKKRFNDEIVSLYSLRPNQSKPAKFLRSIYRSHPRQTRFENYLFEMSAISNVLVA